MYNEVVQTKPGHDFVQLNYKFHFGLILLIKFDTLTESIISP